MSGIFLAHLMTSGMSRNSNLWSFFAKRYDTDFHLKKTKLKFHKFASCFQFESFPYLVILIPVWFITTFFVI